MEELQREKKIVTLTEVKPTQDGYRWVAITAMLLAIGIILHTVSPNVGGVTPNWTIAMYSIVPTRRCRRRWALVLSAA